MAKRRRSARTGPKASGHWDKNRNRVSTPKVEPTQEWKNRQREIIGTDMKPDDPHNDLRLGGTPLDALYARKLISERQREAGERYARLHALRFRGLGPKFPTGLNWRSLVAPNIDGQAFEPRPADDLSDEDTRKRDQAIQQAYDAVDGLVRRVGSSAHTQVQNVCCFWRWPGASGLTSEERLKSTERALKALCAGLTALATHWRIPAREEPAADRKAA